MIRKIESRPYKLLGKIQNYEWGTKNDEAFIPKFIGIEVEKDVPYAEYWIGIHPKAPSDLVIENDKYSLIELLKDFPIEILGKRISKKFNNTLPFLLKILSINKALSIQTHPDKKLASALHEKDPKNYPDNNHKPEIAIAIDNLKAIVGLKTLSEIISVIDDNPEFKVLFNNNLLNKTEPEDKVIKKLYTQLMSTSLEKLEYCISSLIFRLEKKVDLRKEEEQFIIQYKNYGVDIGLISIMLFNHIELKRGDAIFTPAGIPHAYIKGNIVECMANSDNVVRAGLTPKFKDIKTLTEMIEVDSSKSIVDIRETDAKVVYKTAADEFEITYLKLEKEFVENENDDINIILVVDGEILISWNGESQKFSRGEVVLIPAVLNNYSIVENKSSLVYHIKVPK